MRAEETVLPGDSAGTAPVIACYAPPFSYSFAANGEGASAGHFREHLQTSSLINYINYISDDMLWESETSGGWANADRMLFSFRGNSYEWNRFYLNGFRLDSHFFSGSMLYVPDMQQTNLQTDSERGALYLEDFGKNDRFSVEGNIGGIGGISPGTRQIINIFHKSAEERLWKPIEVRNHQLWAGETSLTYGIPSSFGRKYYQRLYANFGSRRIVRFNEGGVISSKDPEPGFYDAPYCKVQLDGKLPLGKKVNPDRLSLHYVLDYQQRPDLYSEFGYGSSEVADYKGFSASAYVNYEALSDRDVLTTGFTYALHDVCRTDRNYERNIVDQDGEGFDPWFADGRLHELSLPVRFVHRFADVAGLKVLLDSYNSFLHFSQAADSWGHNLYVQYENMPREDWYRYDFSGRDFSAGMLENTLSIHYDKSFTRWFALRVNAGIACDGIVLRDKHLLMPSAEAELALKFHRKRWFDASLILGHYRTKYTWNQLRLLSSDYQNGVLSGSYAPYPYYGGEYLAIRKGIQQPKYAVVDLPIEFTVDQKGGKSHKFSILSTARLYYHNWTIAHNPSYQLHDEGSLPYVLTYQEPVVGAGMFALPLYLSNTLKYTYQGPKVFFSLSWQSYQMSGLTTLGNGPENNSISTLQYSMLYPTLGENLKNPESPVRALGRLDQDKAFIFRIQLGANITKNLQYMLNFHFQDGTPICNYVTDGGRLYARNTKGINPSDGHFGMRKDAYFNMDMKLSYRGNINMRNQQPDAPGALPFAVELLCYNIYDFGTTWYEYSFDQYMEHGRRTLAEVIPRGLTLKLSVGLSKNR